MSVCAHAHVCAYVSARPQQLYAILTSSLLWGPTVLRRALRLYGIVKGCQEEGSNHIVATFSVHGT